VTLDAALLSRVEFEDIPTVGSLAFASGNRAAAYAVPCPAQDYITEAVTLGVAWFAKLPYGTARFIRHIALTPFIAHKFKGKLSAKWILGIAHGAWIAAPFVRAWIVVR